MEDVSERERRLFELDQALEQQQRQAMAEANRVLDAQDERIEQVMREASKPKPKPHRLRKSAIKLPSGSGATTQSLGRKSDEVRSEEEKKIAGDEDLHHDDDPSGEITALPKEIGKDATIRLQRAKLKTLHEESKQLKARNNVVEQKLSSAQNASKKLHEQNTKLSKQLQQSQNNLEKQKDLCKSLKGRIGELESTVSNLEKELKSNNAEAKKAQNQGNSMEIRLNRAYEEIERYKSKLQASQASQREVEGNGMEAVQKLQEQTRKLERQNSELLTAFRKQMKLVDVLKKQKMHIEAAQLLHFTEEEFNKALDQA